MRFCLLLFVFAVLAVSDAALTRRKRFLRPIGFPEELFRVPEHFRELPSFGRGLHHIEIPILRTSPLEAIFGIPSRRFSVPEKKDDIPIKTLKPNIHRELEDPIDEEESKVHAEEVLVDLPTRPEPESEPEVEIIPDRKVPIFINPFAFNPQTFSFGISIPWWKGPNVCVEKSEIDEPETEEIGSRRFRINFEATQCSPTEMAYTCTKKIRNNQVRKTIVVKHQCCHGYVKRTDGKPGCDAVPMDDLMETMKSLEANKFADMILSTNLGDKLATENFTVFAPSNDGILDFEDESESNEIVKTRPSKDFSYLVGGHLIDDFVLLGSDHNPIIRQSVNGKTTIRVDRYKSMDNSVTTANCVPLVSRNNLAKNGIVHVTERVLPLPRKTIAEIITQSPQLTVFTTLLEQHDDILNQLKDTQKEWTIFVPTDKAFEKMNPDMLQELLTGEGCVKSILLQHMTRHVSCSAALKGHYVYRVNNLGNTLMFTRDEIDKLRINGAKVSTTDVVGTNGVVHFIDEVLIPREAQGIFDYLKDSEEKGMMELIKLANLEPTFKNLKNVTFFVPSKDAIKEISNKTMQEWKENPEKLKEILLYHVVAPRTSAYEFEQKELPSFAEDQSVRVRLHDLIPGLATASTAQCSVLGKHNIKVCGAYIHVLDKVMTPPKGSIIDALKSMERHDTLIKLLESTDLEKKLSNEGEGPYTLLAPTDEAFERFDQETLQGLLDNKTKAEQILRMHVLPEFHCCSFAFHESPFRHHYVRTMEGNLLPVHRGRNERVRYGPARTISCDTTTKNGIIHSVNRVIIPNKTPVTTIFDIFGSLFKV